MRRWECQCLRRLDLAQYEALGLLVFEETGPAMVKPLLSCDSVIVCPVGHPKELPAPGLLSCFSEVGWTQAL